MSDNEAYAITSSDIEAFHRDGAVLLKGALDRNWLELLEDALQ